MKLHKYSSQRARDRQIKINDFTETQWIEIRDAAQGKCFYCQSDVGTEKLIAEHKTPLCRDGHNTASNIVASCVSCNARKGKRTAEEFAIYKSQRKYTYWDQQAT